MRRLYKLLSWDYETHLGLATDGTSFDREPITFDVFEQDLDPEHHSHLLLEEVFSVEEAPDRSLHDIVIERGARAVQPVRPSQDVLTDTDVESIVANMSTVDAQEEFSTSTGELSPQLRLSIEETINNRIAKLESRVSKLERIYEVKVDDHK